MAKLPPIYFESQQSKDRKKKKKKNKKNNKSGTWSTKNTSKRKEPIDLRGVQYGTRISNKEDTAQSQRDKEIFGKKTSKVEKFIAKNFTYGKKGLEKERAARTDEEKEVAEKDFKKRALKMGVEAGATVLGGEIIGAGIKGVKALSTAGKVGTKGTGRITEEVFAHKVNVLTGKLMSRGTKVIQRGFIGGPANPSGVNKLFKASGNVVRRFPTNTKSAGLTKKFLIGAGMSLGAASLAKDALGTYPFAGFIREEALQTLGFAFNSAEKQGDLEGMDAAIEHTKEILNHEKTFLDNVPWLNVQRELKRFFEATGTKLETDERTFERMKSGEPSATDLKYQQIREENEAYDLKKQEEEDARYENIKEESKTADLEEMKWKSEYFQLIRDGKYEEAETLLNLQS